MSDIRQQPDEQVHALNTRITNVVNNCRFEHPRITIKIMLLQHAIKYHKACDWIRLQDPATLTYKTLLHHCKLLEQRCKQFRKAQQKGQAELTTLTTASTTQTSLHQDAITIQYNCYRCGYKHQKNNCPATGQRCHKCNAIGHFTTLCRTQTHSHGQSRHHYRRPRHGSRSPSRDSSTSTTGSRHSISPATHNTYSQHRHRWSPTPHHIDSITITRPSAASNIDTNETKQNQKRPPPPPSYPGNYTAASESDLDTDDTTSEICFTVHSQDEGSLSTDDTTPKTFHILMTPPPRTLNEPLTGPSKINTTTNNTATNALQQPKQPPQEHPNPKPVKRTLLLPTLTVPTQQNRTRTLISGPPQHNNTRHLHNSTFSGPSKFPDNRFQQHLPRPFHLQPPPLLPLPLHQIPAFSGPYQQAPGHLTLQVYTYLPILLL